MKDENIADLVIRAQRGDTQAFDCLVRRFQDRAVGYARAQLRFDLTAAEDAAQEAFVRAWHDLPTLKTPEAFPAWLRRIVFKYCDRFRRAANLSHVPLDDALNVAGGLEPVLALEAGESAVVLSNALETLPCREREAALLYYRDEYDLAEIAAFLGVPRTTVKNRLHSARKRLRKELWEMAEQILDSEKPSRDDAFSGKVLVRIIEEFREQMRANPHEADRSLLTQARQALDMALASPGPLDWETVRSGFALLLRQDDREAVPLLLRRYLAQPLDDAHRIWAYLTLSNRLAYIRDAEGAVDAYEALERLVPGTNARLSPDWPHDPLPADGGEAASVSGLDILLLAVGQGGEFADAWFAVGRGEEYLAKIDNALARSAKTDANREWRFYCLRMAASRCGMHREIERARRYIAQMYALADEPQPESESRNWRAKAMVHELDLSQGAEDKDRFMAIARAEIELIADAQDDWVAGERHNLAHRLVFAGEHALALPLFERILAERRCHVNPWGYLMHAAAHYRVTGDRERALTLLRDGAVRAESDLTDDFRALPEFADVKDAPEFLAAVRKPQ